MTLSPTLMEYLEWEEVPYDVITHPTTHTSLETARLSHIPASRMAKCVVLGDGSGYLLAVVPADQVVDIDYISRIYHRDFTLASEDEIADLFYDCATGAIPPLGEAYGFDTIIDRELWHAHDVYFEAGDHEALLHLNGGNFKKLMEDAVLGDICERKRYHH